MIDAINDIILDEMARDFAEEILAETENNDQQLDLASEYASGSEWVIYSHKAHALCHYCNTDSGEAHLSRVGMPKVPTYNDLASMIAYGEIYYRICRHMIRF